MLVVTGIQITDVTTIITDLVRANHKFISVKTTFGTSRKSTVRAQALCPALALQLSRSESGP
jgi:hypothetical protein